MDNIMRKVLYETVLFLAKTNFPSCSCIHQVKTNVLTYYMISLFHQTFLYAKGKKITTTHPWNLCEIHGTFFL